MIWWSGTPSLIATSMGLFVIVSSPKNRTFSRHDNSIGCLTLNLALMNTEKSYHENSRNYFITKKTLTEVREVVACNPEFSHLTMTMFVLKV